MYSHVLDGDPVPPLIRRLAGRRFTPAQLVAIDAAAVAVVIVAVEFVMTRRTPRVSGGGWDTAIWTAYAVAAAATLIGGGPQVAQAAIASVALIGLGWLAGENTRAGRVYAGQQA